MSDPKADLRGLMGLPPADDHEALLALLGAPEPREPATTTDLVSLDDAAIALALAAQVGPRWEGLDALAAEARTALEAVASRLRSPQSPADACQAAAARHAFVTGVILDLASRADMSGGMAAWGFRTPPADPVLRAITTSYGRPTIPQGAFGAVAHWIAERGLGRPIAEPCLDVAAVHARDWIAARRPVPATDVGACAW